jgi:hypothetical protein
VFRLKTYFLIFLFIFTSPVIADWSLSKLFLNKVPLEAKDKKDIQQFFIAQIQVAKMGLNCFPKAQNKQQALHCAKVSDKKMDLLMNAPESNAQMMQDRVNKSPWNAKQKALLIDQINLNLKRYQKTVPCIGKARTVGDLDRCFKQ